MYLKSGFCFALAALLCCTAVNADVFTGNGNDGFGGALGNGSLEIVDNCDETLTFCLNLSTALSGNNSVIIYLDTQPGGFTSTANFTDTGDPIRRGISNYDGNNPRTTIDFAPGFEPDFAIGADAGFQGLWGLASNPASHNFVSGNGGGGTKYTFTATFADLGISQGDSIQFGVTHTSDSGFLSNETISGPGSTGFDPDANPGFGSQVTLDSLTFNTKPVPEPSTAILLACVSFAALVRRRS